MCSEYNTWTNACGSRNGSFGTICVCSRGVFQGAAVVQERLCYLTEPEHIQLAPHARDQAQQGRNDHRIRDALRRL